jgi:hypothetical protein
MYEEKSGNPGMIGGNFFVQKDFFRSEANRVFSVSFALHRLRFRRARLEKMRRHRRGIQGPIKFLPDWQFYETVSAKICA